jgi:hypothetical protein
MAASASADAPFEDTKQSTGSPTSNRKRKLEQESKETWMRYQKMRERHEKEMDKLKARQEKEAQPFYEAHTKITDQIEAVTLLCKVKDLLARAQASPKTLFLFDLSAFHKGIGSGKAGVDNYQVYVVTKEEDDDTYKSLDWTNVPIENKQALDLIRENFDAQEATVMYRYTTEGVTEAQKDRGEYELTRDKDDFEIKSPADDAKTDATFFVPNTSREFSGELNERDWTGDKDEGISATVEVEHHYVWLSLKNKDTVRVSPGGSSVSMQSSVSVSVSVASASSA